jgi:hypothetical protein
MVKPGEPQTARFIGQCVCRSGYCNWHDALVTAAKIHGQSPVVLNLRPHFSCLPSPAIGWNSGQKSIDGILLRH